MSSTPSPEGLSYAVPGPFFIDVAILPLVPDLSGGAADSWACEPQLPQGLNFSTTDGEISGTPTELSPVTEYVITASNEAGNSSFTLPLSVIIEAPCNLGYQNSTPVYQQGSEIVANLPIFECGTPTSWESIPPLPLGLLLDTGSGIISGNPSELISPTEHLIQASNSTGLAETILIIEVVPPAPCDLAYSDPQASYIQGVAITENLPLFGCGDPETWSVDPQLPEGISIDSQTGEISGAPLSLQEAVLYTVTASNVSGSDSAIISIEVLPQAPCDLQYSSPLGLYTLGIAIEPNLPVHGCGDPDSWSIDPQLPAGLLLDPVTGAISGTPLALSAAALYTVTASNVSGSDSVSISLEVVPQAPCDLSYPVTQASYLLGLPIAVNLPSQGCGEADSWSINPALPEGISFDSATGLISGTPQVLASAASHTVTATNVSGSDSTVLSIEVLPQAPCDLTYSIPQASYTLGMAITSNLPVQGCGEASDWLVDPQLPDGINLDPLTGEISGTPLALSAAVSYTVTASNVSGSDSAVISIEVLPQAPCDLAYTTSQMTYTMGVAITPNLPLHNCGEPSSWLVDPQLPAGLALDSLTGVISGTPLVLSATASYTVTASNISGSDSTVLSIEVLPQAPCDLTYTGSQVSYILGIAINPNLPLHGCGEPSGWLIDPQLPEGITLDPQTGIISGTPLTLAAAASYTVTASNISGSDSTLLSLEVLPQAPCDLGYNEAQASYTAGMAITPNLATFSCGDPENWSVDPQLPAGLLLDSQTGTISGTPTIPGAVALYTVTASNVSGSDSTTVSIEVLPEAPCDLGYTTPAASYIVGAGIVPNIPLYNCGDPDTWSVDPQLPEGIELDPVTGVIFGSPTTIASAASFTVTASNVSGSDSIAISIEILQEPPCNLTYPTSVLTLELGEQLVPQMPTVGCGDVEQYVVQPALPLGFSFNPASGIISGSAQEETPETVYFISAENSTGSDVFELTISVVLNPPCGLTYDLLQATYYQDLQIEPNFPMVACGTPTLFSIDPQLPLGLFLDPDTGIISGTPAVDSGLTSYIVAASNLSGESTIELLVEVLLPVPCDFHYPVTSLTQPMGVPIDPLVPAIGCGVPTSFTVSPALPAGLDIDGTTGAIFGTALSEGPAITYTIEAANSYGSISTTLEIRISDVFHFFGTSINTTFDMVTGVGTASTTVSLEESSLNPTFPTWIAGLSFALQHDPALLTPGTITQGPALSSLNSGGGPDFWITNQLDDSVVAGVVVSFTFSEALLAPSTIEVLELAYETIPGALQGVTDVVETNLVWGNTGGVPPIDNLVVVDGNVSVKPVVHDIPVILVPVP